MIATLTSHTPPAPRLRLLLLVCVSFAFSFQFYTRLAAVFAEEVGGFGFGIIQRRFTTTIRLIYICTFGN